MSRRRSLKNQVLVFAIIPMGVVSLLCTYLSVAAMFSHGEERIRAYEETLMAAKREALKNYATMAIQAVINLPPEDVREHLKYMRYGNGNDYFWVNDFSGLMLSHPDPGLDGKDQSGLKDPKGFYIIREAIKLCQAKGEGYIHYVWKNPISGKIGDKLSYVVTIPKWNWILGTGVYTDDVQQMVAREQEKIRGDIFNASLEAASAGEAGKRFGVVAAEIRRLADSVMDSTGEIESKVNKIQEAIQRLVVASEKGSKTIREGMDYSVKIAELLTHIVSGTESTTNAARQISISTQQEKTASGQIVVALREIDKGGKQASDSIQQISSISNDLKNLSADLMKLVKQFRLEKGQPEVA